MKLITSYLLTIAAVLLSPYLVVASEDHKIEESSSSSLRMSHERTLQFTCPAHQRVSGTSSCATCPDGQVQNPTNPTGGCVWCANGTVRGKDGKAESGCVPAKDTCDFPHEIGQYGKCSACPTGQVGNEPDRSACIWCANGSVRGSDGLGTTGCELATTVCTSPEDIGQYGKCAKCPTGQVGDGEKKACIWCPNGSVRGELGTGSAGCESAVSVCTSPEDIGQYGTCAECPTGQVGDTLKKSCVWCPNGSARGSDGKGTLGCESAATACPRPEDIGQYGKCAECPIGQVADDLKKACVWCPNGSVRGNENGTGEGGCINAAIKCPGAWQYGQYGKCQQCPKGQNANSAKTGCEWCPDGTVKGDRTGLPQQACTSICRKSELAQYGVCTQCPAGQVGGPGSIGCKYCTNGFVRGEITDTSDPGCIPAAGPCPSPEQIGQYGKCATCPTGQVGDDLKKACIWCPNGSVRGASGTGSAGCESAVTVCTSPEDIGQYGKCAKCPTGQVGDDLKKTCVWCATGTVRGVDGTGTSGCQPAKDFCSSTQIGQYGKCANCPSGQVSDADRKQCKNP